ncbi:ribosome small subunit-dependent GTPase A [Alkaliphilus pronyensis]|nr:ribosome small subunit-dependent GTPase A [Alkaliphilus pronyensis]
MMDKLHMINIEKYGYDSFFKQQFELRKNENLVPGRVIGVYKSAYKVMTLNGEVIAELSGNYYNRVIYKSDFPCVGDWLLLNKSNIIIDLMERKTKLSRKTPGKKVDEQILAANVDVLFIVTSLNKEFNSRRIERYLATAINQGIKPAIILTKMDACNDVVAYIEKLNQIAPEVTCIFTSAYEKVGIEGIFDELSEGKTGVFIGSSGVGKSTLVNVLMGEEVQKTFDIRIQDHKGRHTTTHRELFILANNGNIIDTPGIREIHLWSDNNSSGGFEDIEEYARQCRFRDCQHIHEHDCAVRKAIEENKIDKERFKNYLKLQRELYYSSLQHDKREKIAFQKQIKRKSKIEGLSLKK